MSHGIRLLCSVLLTTSVLCVSAQFGTGQSIVTNGHNAVIRAADLDGDGDIDLFGVFGGRRLKWFDNTDGQGAFGEARTIVELDDHCTLAKLADVDGDLDMDVLVVSDDDGIVLLRNEGDGTFAEPELIELDDMPGALAVADINGDGHPDLLVTLGFAEGAGIGIFFGSEDGFGPVEAHSGLHSGGASPTLEVGDMDLVGGLDLLLSAANDTLVVARNTAGDASEWHAAPMDITGDPLNYVYQRPVLMDIDNDGDLDIASARGSAVHWLRNVLDEGGAMTFEENVVEPWTTSGDGAFGRTSCSAGACMVFVPNNPSLAVRWNSYVPLMGGFVYSNELPSLPRGRRPLLADLNGDGNDDLVMEVNGELQWFPNTLTEAEEVLLELPVLDTLCLVGAPVEMPEAVPAGGRWYGWQMSNGLLFRSNLPSTMDLPLKHAVYAEGGCPMADSTSVHVILRPEILTTVPSLLCSADAVIVMEAVPAGVEWYGLDGGNVIDPAVWNGGYVVCEYTDATGQMCSALEGPIMRWNTLPAELARMDTLCTTDGLTDIAVVAAPPLGVVWEGPVLNATAAGAQFDPSIGPGTYTVILNAEAYAPNQCRNSDTLQVVVAPPPAISFEPMAVYCADGDAIDLVGATPEGGVWSGAGVSAGRLDPAAVGEGVHLVNYFTTSDVGCSAMASTTITLATMATVSGDDLLLCDGDGPVQFTAYPAGGTWSAPLHEDGTFSIDTLEHGIYTVHYTYVDPRGCALAQEPLSVTYGMPTHVEIDEAARLCLDGPSFELTGSAAGTWSGAVSGEGPSVLVDPSVLGVGTWPVTLYVIPDGACPGEATAYLVVDVCAGVEEVFDGQLSAAPMPFSGRTTVRFGTLNVRQVDVFDASGKRVQAIDLGGSHPERMDIDLSGFADGVYILHATGETGTTRLRLVKAH